MGPWNRPTQYDDEIPDVTRPRNMRAVANRQVRLDCGYRNLAFRRRTRHNREVGRVAVIGLFVLIWFLAPPMAEGGPFKDFFRKVRHTFTEKSSPSSSSHRTTHRPRAEEGQPSASKVTTVNRPPNERNTRSARRAAAHRSSKSDLPYGVPVPGKTGFVTSPFAPDSGYVDVRGIPAGTEVKDPYTSKVFLTP